MKAHWIRKACLVLLTLQPILSLTKMALVKLIRLSYFALKSIYLKHFCWVSIFWSTCTNETHKYRLIFRNLQFYVVIGKKCFINAEIVWLIYEIPHLLKHLSNVHQIHILGFKIHYIFILILKVVLGQYTLKSQFQYTKIIFRRLCLGGVFISRGNNIFIKHRHLFVPSKLRYIYIDGVLILLFQASLT